MKTETKRIFISDLPENISESDLREKFSAYGDVSAIEIKQRKELGPRNYSLCFAFVNLTVNDSSLQRCFEDFSNKKWKGQYVELQLAKESFLSRLKKEREEAKSVTTEVKKNNNTVLNGLPKLHLTGDNCIEEVNIKKSKLKGEQIVNETNFTTVIVKNNQQKSIREKLKIESVGNEPIIKIEKAKPKSKDPKRAEADSKRIQSMIEMKKGYMQQKLLIRNALSKIDIKPTNKIIFDDEQNINTEIAGTISTQKGKSLFEEEDDDDKEYNFEIKEQFQGKKGQKLLELQSKYKQDERFTLSSKFLEDEEIEEQSESALEDETDEKKKQLRILEKVLGQKIHNPEKQAEDNNKKRKAMLRFDPAQPDHVKYEMKTEEVTNVKKKHKRKTEESKNEEENKPVVSKEKFYKITENLKDVLHEKKSFSLLDTFGNSQEIDASAPDAEEENIREIRASTHRKIGETNPFKYDSSDDNSDHEQTANDKNIESTKSNTNEPENSVNLGPSRLWTEPFFFKDNDHRFQEGIDFLKKLQTDETTEFSKVRRDLVEIVRAKVKNNQRRNRPFKKKLGGRKMLKIKKAMKR